MPRVLTCELPHGRHPAFGSRGDPLALALRYCIVIIPIIITTTMLLDFNITFQYPHTSLRLLHTKKFEAEIRRFVLLSLDMAKTIDNATQDEPSAVPFRTGGRLARQYEYLVFYFLTISSWCLEIAAACIGSLYGGESHLFIATVSPFLATHWAAFLQTCWMMATAPRHTIPDRMAYLNLACRFQRLCAPTALIGMITWAVAYRFRGEASSQAYWIIFLVVWITTTVFCLMNVSNNINWESSLLAQIAPDCPQGNFWLAALGIRSMCQAKHKHHDNTSMELKQPTNMTA